MERSSDFDAGWRNGGYGCGRLVDPESHVLGAHALDEFNNIGFLQKDFAADLEAAKAALPPEPTRCPRQVVLLEHLRCGAWIWKCVWGWNRFHSGE